MLYTKNMLRLTLKKGGNMKKLIITLTTILSVFLLSSCVSRYSYIEGKINILTSTTMLGDLAKQIGKDQVVVTTLMQTGTDPHSYKPKPSDRYAAKKADLIIYNGLHLEAKMNKLFEETNPDKLFIAGEKINSNHILKDENNEIDPHIWFDVNIWKELSYQLKLELQTIDPLHSENYENNYLSYKEELITLENYIKEKVNQLPEEKRILITAHDAFNYFGHAYGFKVYAIQGISTETEASTKDIQNLAKLVKDLNVKAIFIENSIPEATIKGVIDAALALGQKVTIGGELYSDSLGDINSLANTYIQMFYHNINTIIDSLT